ncbi:hypothetical protein BDU57DRAFT_349837 [Ampelomyces quisqualis]|uniref:Uncharacterized protein n=1 Tax=Ampelomyces quisqualis TaxID=50730 RepID=A0A6A5QGT9_AMPQU|nr:hypothetical protein BDU57DRAFT_349837 [Ampelomyces quisqualis]
MCFVLRGISADSALLSTVALEYVAEALPTPLEKGGKAVHVAQPSLVPTEHFRLHRPVLPVLRKLHSFPIFAIFIVSYVSLSWPGNALKIDPCGKTLVVGKKRARETVCSGDRRLDHCSLEEVAEVALQIAKIELSLCKRVV